MLFVSLSLTTEILTTVQVICLSRKRVNFANLNYFNWNMHFPPMYAPIILPHLFCVLKA